MLVSFVNTFNPVAADVCLISNLAPGLVDPIPILPLSNIDPVAILEVVLNLTT